MRLREVQEFIDLPHPVYCERYLKIRTKEHGIQPLILNKGQLVLHEHAEAQLIARGYIRTLLLKSRQWGGCLSPDTLVLTSDLRWIPLRDISEGDLLVACDEKAGRGKGSSRKMRTAAVKKIWRTYKPSYRITLEDGVSVICSQDHRWLSKSSCVTSEAEWRSIASTHPDGIRGALRPGYWLRTVTEQWDESSLEDYWFGGMIDGEGSFNMKKSSGGSCLKISQLAGAVLNRMQLHCENRSYGHFNQIDNPRQSMYGKRPVHSVCISSIRNLFRVIGLSRPTRFIGKLWWEGRRLPDNGWRRIKSIEVLQQMELIDIETSTGTFIANGIVSHNSTYIQSRAYRKVTSGPMGTKAYIMTHRKDTTAALFGMAKRFHDFMPHQFKTFCPGGSAMEMRFPKRDSMYSVGTAGGQTSVGHGETIQFLHASEFALWPNADEHLKGIFQTVPNMGKGSEIFIESTAKGMGNSFHRMVVDARKGNSDYWFLFVPWFWFPEYSAPVPPDMTLTAAEELYQSVFGLTDEQMAFRQQKIIELGGGEIGESAFCNQYPTTPEDAFRTPTVGSYFDAVYVVRARKTVITSPYGVKIMGIDPSHLGGDRFSVCLRQGRKATHVGEWRKKRTTESLGLCVKLINEHRPAYVFVDQGGPGAGIVDPLMEHAHSLGCSVIPVDFGGSADDPDRYNNKREEMYGRTKNWLEGQMPVQIDDADDLQADLTNPQARYDNAGRVQPESKQIMCKPPRNLPSPDKLESLVLTFAFEVGDGKLPGGNSNDDIDPNRPINWRT